jgi:exodeoxyribonuclease-3
MRIATWNVNSLKVRLPHVLDWLASTPVDVLCVQETKLTDDKFPAAALEQAGYGSVFAGQPAYNGVAVLTRTGSVGAAELVSAGNPHFDDPQKRLLAVRVGGMIVVCAYFPNGQSLESEKFVYKLAWIDSLNHWLRELRADSAPLVLAGDFNIAPEDRDVHDPALWAGQLHCSPQERERFRALLDCGLVDAFRLFEQPPRAFSWWDYRQLAFRRNAGLRIDHILVDTSLQPRVRACTIDKLPRKREQPSDHAPVVVEISDGDS